jgi:hypothetical protein
MSDAHVVDFLRSLGSRGDLLAELRDKPKEAVLAAAAQAGFPFSDAEFNALIWDLEARLAEHRGEPFDQAFPLWHLMWGRYYLEFLVSELMPSITETDLLT